VSEVGGDGPLVAPLIWLGVGRATSERIDRFVAGLVWCFFPVGPVFWLIAHFVGGGWALFAIWILLTQSERRPGNEGASSTLCTANLGSSVSGWRDLRARLLDNT
jgi:hypothetical protein